MKEHGLILIYSVIVSTFLITSANLNSPKNDGKVTLNKLKHTQADDTKQAISLTMENCIKNLFHIKAQHFLTTDCCFSKMCPNFGQVAEKYPQIKELLLKLCSQNLQLRELLNGCCFENNLDIVNTNTNFNSMSSNKENSSITNCSGKFHPATMNDQTAQINSDITGDFKKGSGKAARSSPMANPFKSETNTETSNSDADIKKIRPENLTESSSRDSGLQFLDIPRGDDMRIQDLRLDEEYLLFKVFSKIMGYLLPAGFPSDLLRDALNNHVPWQVLSVQILKIEIVLVVWLMLWALLSLCLPIAVAANLCCSNNIRRLNEDFSNGSTNSAEKWSENMMGFVLHMLLILLLSPIILILAGNEQIARSISRSPASANIIYEDINTFLRNTHMQMSFVVTSSTDIAIEAIRKDLEDVDVLLGKPYQQELCTETGVDVALIGLEELKTSTSKVTSLVADLLDECVSARTAGSLLQEQLREIASQLTVMRQQCSMKDRALCYTLQYSGFDVSFSVDNLTNDDKIKQLQHSGTEESFNTTIETARKSFSEVPDLVSLNTATYIADMKSLLSRKRTEVYKSTHALDVLTESLSETVKVSQESVSTVIQRMAEWDLWRWLAVLGMASILSLIWGLLLCGAPCGCGLTSRTIPFLLSGVGLSGIVCIFAWGLGTLSLLVGGHADSLICQALYDQPHYRTLADLLDADGILYGEEGFFKTHFNGNATINIAEVLRNCQMDQPVYRTFHLHSQINVNKITNYKEWDDLRLLFSNFTVGSSNLEILSPTLQLSLQVLSSITTANLTGHRMQLSAPITKRDLSSFADQLNTVARQLTDPVSSRKIDNLAFAVRKIVRNEMQKISEIRSRILFKITTLEVLLPPLNRQANQSLSHLKTIQYFLDNEGWQISERTRRRFISRIESHLEQLHNYVNIKITKEIGKCRPLWEIFHSSRFYVCKLIVDPLNGIAFSSFFLILLFLTISPVVIKLVEYYRENNEDILTSISHRRSRDGLIIDDEGTWATPFASTSEIPLRQAASNVAERTTVATWTSPTPPRQPSHQRIPPPPRPPSTVSSVQSPRFLQNPASSRERSPKSKLATITSRISKARNRTHKPISRSRSPRRGRNQDSLRLVEPICWKAGSTTPRSWI